MPCPCPAVGLTLPRAAGRLPWVRFGRRGKGAGTQGQGPRGVSLGPSVAFLAWHQALCLQTVRKGRVTAWEGKKISVLTAGL